MPLTALDRSYRGRYIHGPTHDLESLLQTTFAFMCFTTGPCGQVRQPADRVPTSRWFNEIDREQLLKDKVADLVLYDTEIEEHITDYWKPFAPYLRRLVKATWPTLPPLLSQATHKEFKKILEEALVAIKKVPERRAKYAPVNHVPQKRPRSPKVDESRFPYNAKFSRGGPPNYKRFSRPANIKKLSSWQDSVDA